MRGAITPESRTTAYGAWRSPISAALAASGVSLSDVMIDRESVFWIELRRTEEGRHVVMQRTADGRIADVTSQPFSVRTLVHEYGGGAFVPAGETIYFSNYSDQRLYRQEIGGQPRPISPQEDIRYADGVVDRKRDRIICVREDHTAQGRVPVNSLASLNIDGEKSSTVLVSGNDFYSSPRLSPDGTRLAWLAWDHPTMPFDGTQLWVGELDREGMVGKKQCVTGRTGDSIAEPVWSPAGVLHFISDRTGWWNLFRWRDGKIESLCHMDAEFTRPQWQFGGSTYAFQSEDRIFCGYAQSGVWFLAILDTRTSRLTTVENRYTDLEYIRAVGKDAVFLASSPREPSSIIRFNSDTNSFELLYRPAGVEIDSGYLSIPQHVEFPTSNGLTAYGFIYSPQNKDYKAPPDELPPLLVISHGGPTHAASTKLDFDIQYWTSRGFAVFDVNYGGSSGYGRAYRHRLKGQWGIVDVDDCANGALSIARKRMADQNRLVIRGGSAGGYTTLCALAFRSIFRAGTSLAGLTDLELFEKTTHKFESHYLDSLIGPYPECRMLYRERSPINFIDRVSVPVLILQGLEDKVVPPSQAEFMVEALRRRGVPVAYVPFQAEQHGLRRAANIRRALENELYFYSRVLGFEPAGVVEPVRIENL